MNTHARARNGDFVTMLSRRLIVGGFVAAMTLGGVGISEMTNSQSSFAPATSIGQNDQPVRLVAKCSKYKTKTDIKKCINKHGKKMTWWCKWKGDCVGEAVGNIG